MFQTFTARADGTASPGRVARLRAGIEALGATGFLIPRADAHQGENVAPRDERLAWMTGFTGSAGAAVVLKDRAALFVDGRYTLQVTQQADMDLWEVVPIHQISIADWLGTALRSGDRLAYDPWLHGSAEISQLRAVAEPLGAELVAVGENPVDAIWTDQPAPPAGAIRIHPDTLSGEPSADKRARIGAAIAAKGGATAVLSLPDSIAWLLNIRGTDIGRSPVAQGFALVGSDGHTDLIMDPAKADAAVLAHLGNDVTIHPVAALSELVAGLKGPVLLDTNACPLWFAERLEAAGTDILWGTDPCTGPKSRKTDAELDGMRAAHVRDGAAMVRFLCWLDEALAKGQTLTEIDVVTKLEEIRAGDGDLRDISFETICGSGPNGAIVHYRVTHATNRTIVPGDLLLVDSGAQYPDGTTDITRTMATGPVTGQQRRDFTLVLKGMIAISRARWPAGVRGRDLDPLARAAMWRAGLDYDHGTGHGVGACLNVHEGPQSLSRRGEAVLEAGMILSNEPGCYVEGAYGIRIENLVIITPPDVPDGGRRPMLGFETLTWCPIDRRLIEVDLLDPAERAWLDDYHAEVLARIGPLVGQEDAVWLRVACAPL